jgi:hypothetical protein
MTTPDELRRRFQKLVIERDQLLADCDHWNRTHGKDEHLERDEAAIGALLDALAERVQP